MNLVVVLYYVPQPVNCYLIPIELRKIGTRLDGYPAALNK